MTTDKINTGLATIRFDIRTVATIARFYLSKDKPSRTKSELINQIIYDLYAIILENELAEEFTKTHEASLFLENINLSFRHQSTDAQYYKQLSLESLKAEQESSDQTPDVSSIQEAIRSKQQDDS